MTDESINMCDSALIEDMKLAVEVEKLPTQFTLSDIEEWMEKEDIKKLDGTSYPKVTIELLVNYSRYTPITKKRKKKVLYSSLNAQFFSFTPF